MASNAQRANPHNTIRHHRWGFNQIVTAEEIHFDGFSFIRKDRDLNNQSDKEGRGGLIVWARNHLNLTNINMEALLGRVKNNRVR